MVITINRFVAQVLKGPRGTLFGRATTGGAVLLVPNLLTDEVEGYVELSGGEQLGIGPGPGQLET